ncbi:heavy metal translocating P-type ATPase [Cyanobium sp. Aljojuca 7D2]|nr:heavy metal translocating P-type ATPase [Cyanobium sp. Aljojuca 7D2]MCP9889875.1 heavy metal translocating P-type ATPase [Cyanobium sp. Aljojuca 7D2]
MKCGGCVRAVEQRLLDQPGVRQASVNLLTRTAWVDLASAEADQAALLAALAGLGFEARLRSSDGALSSRRERLQTQTWWQHWRQLVVALVLLLVSGLGHLHGTGLDALWIHALVATLALAGPGRPILVRGVQAALAGLPSMDTLVGLGVLSAYLASLVAFLWPQGGWPCFFNEPVMLLGFVLLGRFLEERARFRTGRALEELAELQPDTALLLLGEGPPRPVRVGGLRPGDRVQLLPGDRVPVDGVVLEGASAVDVSGLTGEPLPLQAVAGSELAAGSLNLEAPLVLEVRRRGADSAIARIIHLVERAQARKAPIQGLADRVAGRFTLVVLALAVATLLFWWLLGTQLWPQVLSPAHASGVMGGHPGSHGVLGAGADTPFALALQLAIAVLVVACPCALGLATPVAITVATGRAARAGLLFRGGDAIEIAAGIEALLFDKTGTLTVGRPLVAAVEPLGDLPPDRLVQLAASLEAGSRHPFGFALLQEAQRRGLELLEVVGGHSVAGQGVSGCIADHSLRVGRLAWVDPSPTPELLARQALLECHGASVLAVADQHGLLGLVAVDDQPRPDAASVLEALRGLGLHLGLLSGDRREPVQQLGARLGLASAELAWELRPEQKLERILQHPARGALAMVGDGINDAPALAAADLGIAVGTGTQIAQDTADLVVMGDRLEGIVRALLLARRAMAKVRQNLAWAFGYNLIVLPLAAGVLLPGFGVLLTPPLAALLMALSSITVVVNALLLQDGFPDSR